MSELRTGERRVVGATNGPVDVHEIVAARVAGELSRQPDVLAVMIAGSVARREHVESSDVDLLVVASADADVAGGERQLVDGLLVEWIARTEQEWLSRFDRPKTSWLYAFLDARIVIDNGAAARLQAAAQGMLDEYRTNPELDQVLATWLWHGQAKLDRARVSSDPRVRGYCASLFVETVIDGLYAVHNVPLPAGARLLSYLHLVPLTEDEREVLDIVLLGDVENRFESICTLVDHLRATLGDPDHSSTV